MKIQLLSKPCKEFTPLTQVLLNRGIPAQDIPAYLKHIDEDINPPEAFNKELLNAGVRLIIDTIQNNGKIKIIVDPDVDGLVSSAIIINYLYDLFPSFVINNVEWLLHQGKAHGIDEFIDELENTDFDLLICPDSASNDLESIERLYTQNKKVLILDHHEAEKLSPLAVTINSQYNYPNHTLSGAGVVYQFCKYIDKLMNVNYADKYLDLCAVGLQSDMMDLRNLETKQLIFKGFKNNIISNPLIYGLRMKNDYSLSKADYVPSSRNDLEITPIGCSFFITPLLNAICRSGTKEEKELIFECMLNYKAHEIVPSTKRGHKLNETERKLDQALRTCTNVKNRQTRFEESTIEELEEMITTEDLLQHKVLLFQLPEDTTIPAEIKGLVANKFMARYQRPCAVLSYNSETNTYAGSMRGYEGTGITNFKDICSNSRGTIYAQGHQSAAGLCLDADQIDEFLADTDAALESVSAEPIYYIDYLFYGKDVDEDILIELSDVNDYIGTGISRPFVAVLDLKITSDMVRFMGEKADTLKISLPNGVSIIKFGCSEDICRKFNIEKGFIEIDLVGKPNKNCWGGNVYGQIILEDFEIKDKKGWVF